jgi:hypothetical protein
MVAAGPGSPDGWAINLIPSPPEGERDRVRGRARREERVREYVEFTNHPD